MAGHLALAITCSRFCRNLPSCPLVSAQTHWQRTLSGRCVLYCYLGTNPWLLQRLCLPILLRRGSLAVSVEPGRDRFGECNSQRSFRCEPPCPKRGIGLRPRGAGPADRTAILHL